MKKTIVLLSLLFTVAILFAEDFKIISVTGQSFYEVKNNEWKSIEPNSVLPEETKVKTSINSSILISSSSGKYKISQMKNDTIKNLVAEINNAKSTKLNKSGEVKISNINTSESKRKKRISTAATRAELPEEELNLEEEENYINLEDYEDYEEYDNYESLEDYLDN